MFSKKHVHVLRKTRTTFSENTYVFFSGTNPDIDRHWPTALFSASYLCGKKKHMNKLACIGLITLSVLSCSVSRDSKQRLYKQEKDSISAIRIDHLFHKAGSDSQNHLSATLRQVTLSIPDSTGRQYPLPPPCGSDPGDRLRIPLPGPAPNDPYKPAPPHTYRKRARSEKDRRFLGGYG